MAISAQNKEKLIDTLLETKRKGHRLQITLKFQNNLTKAKTVGDKCRTLSSKIDKLIAQSMRQWLGSASKIIAERKKGNTKLQATINDIKKKKNIANNVVKAVGFIDDAIEAAAKLIT